MSFPTNWDPNTYKTDYESEEHWELRRTFMEAHKESFPESELVCLAQVFTNIELLGCRYPAATMTKVALLSEDVAANFRKLRESRLKRTFVTASDAANAKAKGRKSKNCKKHVPSWRIFIFVFFFFQFVLLEHFFCLEFMAIFNCSFCGRQSC